MQRGLLDHGDPAAEHDAQPGGRVVGEAEHVEDEGDDGVAGVLEDRLELRVGPGAVGHGHVDEGCVLDVGDEGVEPGGEPALVVELRRQVDEREQLGGGGPQQRHVQLAGGGEVVEHQALGDAGGPGHVDGRELVERGGAEQRQPGLEQLFAPAVGVEASGG